MKRSITDSFFVLFRSFLTGWLLLAILMLSVSVLYAKPSGITPKTENTSSAAAASDKNDASSTVEPVTESESAEEIPMIQTTDSPSRISENLAPQLVYYNQKDAVWSDLSYGNDHIGGYGCGPTVCAILISTLTDQKVTPKDMADWSVDNGCYIDGGGSYHNLIPLACKSYGLTVEGRTAADRKEILAALQNGALVGVIMGPGDFTSTGHFIVLYGLSEDGKILVADPASTANSKAWDADVIFSQCRSYAANGGPFWIVTQ